MERDEYDLHVTNNHHISPVAYKITKLSIVPIQILNYCQRIGASCKGSSATVGEPASG